MEWQKEQFTVSTDKTKLDVQMIHNFLSTSAYWAIDRQMSIVRKSIKHSLCFGVYDGKQQVGFTRVVTDFATFGWVCDVFILPSHRGRGLGRWLMECIMSHPKVQSLRRVVLTTRSAGEFYAKSSGFHKLSYPENWMEVITEKPKLEDQAIDPLEAKK